MRTIFRSTMLATTMAFGGGALADLSQVPRGDYDLDKTHAYITFTYSHLGYSTPHVSFDSFDAKLNLDNENPENSTVMVDIDATSVNSRVAEFDEHLNSEDYFDTEKFPQITFNSTSIKSTGENTYDLTGDLTIMGISKRVTLAATINKAAKHPIAKVPAIGLSGETEINRSDWGLSGAIPFVSDEVTIYVTAEMYKADAPE